MKILGSELNCDELSNLKHSLFQFLNFISSNTYSCVRHLATDLSFIFCEFDDHESYHEAYDLLEDLDQMENIAYEILPSVQAKYSLDINHLKNCHGDNCRNIK